MEEKIFNGKTHLLVTYQWSNGTKDAVIIDEVFNTLTRAYEKMDRIMPECMEPDDGYDLPEWAKAMETDDDVFAQFNAQIDDDHNVLAVLRPVTEGGEA